MPATLEPTATNKKTPDTYEQFAEATGDNPDASAQKPVVLNPFIYDAPLRTAHLLSHAQLMSDDQLASAGWLKRITRAAARNYGKDRFDDDTGHRIALWQDDFQRKLVSMDYDTLVAEGHVNKLVENYLFALAEYHQGKVTRLDKQPVTDAEIKDPGAFNRIHDREKALAKKYREELKYVRENADAIKQTALEFPGAIKNPQDMAFGQLIVENGLLNEQNREKAADMVNDTLAAGVAHAIKLMAAPLADLTPDELASYQDDPRAFSTQIRALAQKLRENTQSLAHIQVNDNVPPDLSRVQGLRNLISAELNAALDPKQSPDILVDVLAHLESVVKDYKNVTMSLAHHFLGTGPSAGDPRMQALRAQIGEAMGGNVIPFEHAEAKAEDLARFSAQDLLQVADGKPELQEKLKAVLSQVNPELASERLKPHPGLIGGTVQATIGAFLKLGEKLKAMLGIGNESEMSRAA